MSKTKTLRGPLLTITHGGGPLPLLGSQPELVDLWGKHVDNHLLPARPDAIIVVSAHYHHDGAQVKVLGVEQPKMIFDYSGFPPQAYKFQYPAPGHPALAKRLVEHMAKMPQLSPELDTQWGYDHGVFVPMLAMMKHASIPIVPVSVSSSDDAAVQLATGEAIRLALTSQISSAPVKDEEFLLPNVAVIGSGSMFHNFQPKKNLDSTFCDAFTKLLTDRTVSPAQRKEALLKWDQLPGARDYQPKGAADHMMPLLTLAAVAGYEPATEVVEYKAFNAKSSDFVWK